MPDAQHTSPYKRLVIRHPLLLLGTTQGHENKVWLRCIDLVDDVGVFVGCKFSKGWGICAAYFYRWILITGLFHDFLKHVILSSEEKN
jgi:hypothetical protein